MVRRRASAAGDRGGGHGGGLRGYLPLPAAGMLRRHRRGLRLRGPGVPPARRRTHGDRVSDRRRWGRRLGNWFRVSSWKTRPAAGWSPRSVFARWGSTKSTANWTASGATWRSWRGCCRADFSPWLQPAEKRVPGCPLGRVLPTWRSAPLRCGSSPPDRASQSPWPYPLPESRPPAWCCPEYAPPRRAPGA
jgi:hypothetical protein